MRYHALFVLIIIVCSLPNGMAEPRESCYNWYKVVVTAGEIWDDCSVLYVSEERMNNNRTASSIGEMCLGKYCLYRNQSTWDEAKETCQKYGGRLAVDDDDKTHMLIHTLLRDSKAETAWLGGKTTPAFWQWIQPDASNATSSIFYQGCYHRNAWGTSNPQPLKCTTDLRACEAHCDGFKYAMFYEIPGRDVCCYCGNIFGKHGRSISCKRCSQGKGICGNMSSYAVYALNAVKGRNLWEYGYPDGITDDEGNPKCIALFLRQKNLISRVISRPCSSPAHALCVSREDLLEECKTSPLGKEYTGRTSVTRNGRKCQRWDSQAPHRHTRNDPVKFPDTSLGEASNYCRNPDNGPEGPWCYTTDPSVRWEYCDLPFCQCKTSQRGEEYTGRTSVTRNGRKCQRWDSQTPNRHTRNDPVKFPDTSLGEASNYCRNPDNEPEGPWCYTTDPLVRWEYCDLPFCRTPCSSDKYYLTRTGRCILIISNRTQWGEAVRSCEKHHSRLVSFLSYDEYQDVFDSRSKLLGENTSSLFWVYGTSSVWQWQNELNLQISGNRWSDGWYQPPMQNHCLFLNRQGEWASSPCSSRKETFFCVQSVSPTIQVGTVEETVTMTLTSINVDPPKYSTVGSNPRLDMTGITVGTLVSLFLVGVVLVLLVIAKRKWKGARKVYDNSQGPPDIERRPPSEEHTYEEPDSTQGNASSNGEVTHNTLIGNIETEMLENEIYEPSTGLRMLCKVSDKLHGVYELSYVDRKPPTQKLTHREPLNLHGNSHVHFRMKNETFDGAIETEMVENETYESATHEKPDNLASIDRRPYVEESQRSQGNMPAYLQETTTIIQHKEAEMVENEIYESSTGF